MYLLDDLILNIQHFDYIKNLIDLLDYGFNFVPCIHLNSQSLFYNTIKNFDNELFKFNSKIFFENNKNKNSKNKEFKNYEIKNSFDSCIEFDCVLNKLREKNNKENFVKNLNKVPFLNQSLEFRFQFILEFSKTKFTHSQNISFLQAQSLKFFSQYKPFVVLECDKNVGACLISESLSDQLALDCLNDTSTYMRLELDPKDEIQSHIEFEINKLEDVGLISKKLKKLLNVDNPKLSKFRILPKIHKKKFSVRPIINCISSPTSKLCLLVYLILQPLVVKSYSYLKDSQHLLQILDKIDFSQYTKNIYMYSCDFESLYSNIDLDLALNILLETVVEEGILDDQHLHISGLEVILKLIFNCNCFVYKAFYFRQIKGIAMGAICGPTIANIVVSKLEKKWIFIHKPLVYKRFIDDIIMILLFELDKIDFQSQFKNLKINICDGRKVIFLDLVLQYDELFKKMRIWLHIKETHNFGYLLVESNHPQIIFKNIPVSLFIRIKRICTEFQDFLFFSRQLFTHLLSKGFKKEFLISVIRNISSIDRKNLIEYKSRTSENETRNDSIWFSIEYNKFTDGLNKTLKCAWNNFNETLFQKFNCNFSISNRKNLNLKQLFVFNSSYSNKNFNFHSFSCLQNNCKICKFMVFVNKIQFNSNFCLPILKNSDCKSKNCVYVLICNCCDSIYVGETSMSFEKRLQAHISNIKNFIPLHKMLSEVAIHFNLKGHNYLDHLKCFIFVNNIINDIHRKSIESELMHLFLIFGFKIINSKIYRNFNNFCTSF